MRAAIKRTLIGTRLYPLAKTLYRHTVQRRYLNARTRLMRFYGPLLERGNLVFDVGSNHGDFSDAFLHLGARVVAVEPHPECARELRLTLVEAAASDSVDGTKRGGRSSLHPESAPSDQTKQSRD
jgi:hypothetical protein